MKHILRLSILLVIGLLGCRDKNVKPAQTSSAPVVEDNGLTIRFANAKSASLFKTEILKNKDVEAEITSPAKVAASIVPSEEGASQNIILFENSDLAGSYMQLIQHQINIRQIENINIKQREIELSRIQDLEQHGAATGKDLLDARTALAMEKTNLANERASLIEHETRLKTGGFNTKELLNATPGIVYIICDIPESQISKIRKGDACSVHFTSFPSEKFLGKIDDLADVVDNTTRMVKLRVNLKNPDNKLKAGMFALVTFGIDEGNNLTVSKSALTTVQGRSYVFVKKDSVRFERREVKIGQQIGDEIVVYDGLHTNEEIAMDGVIQLKGLSFGY